MMCLMRIRVLALDGYKNLSRLKIRLDDITALVALNDFGKSNILAGIDFGLSFLKAGNEEKALMMADSDLIPRNVNMVGRNFNYAMELSMELEGQEYIIQYGYQFAWKSSEKMEPEILSEYLKVKLNEKGQKFSQLIRTPSTRHLRQGDALPGFWWRRGNWYLINCAHMIACIMQSL